MKKIIYIILVCVGTSMCVTACTEDEVNPSTTVVGTQGKESDPI